MVHCSTDDGRTDKQIGLYDTTEPIETIAAKYGPKANYYYFYLFFKTHRSNI